MKTHVIAEAGSCHDGRLDRALALVYAAHAAGADAVKFQWWSSPDRLADRRRVPVEYRQIYRDYQMPLSWVVALSEAAARLGLEFLCTTYLPGDAAQVAPFVRRFKIASFEALDSELLAEAMALGPVIVSGGMQTDEEWRRLMRTLRRTDALLHCVSAYPASPEEMQLAVIARHSGGRAFDFCGWDQWEPIPGLSDHSKDAVVASLAVAAGAEIVEAHLRLDDTRAWNPDYTTAMTPNEFAGYVGQIRWAETIMGPAEKRQQPCEAPLAAYRVTMDPSQPANQRCTECGNPATHRVFDMFGAGDPATGMMRYTRSEKPRYGCAAHPMESRTFE